MNRVLPVFLLAGLWVTTSRADTPPVPTLPPATDVLLSGGSEASDWQLSGWVQDKGRLSAQLTDDPEPATAERDLPPGATELMLQYRLGGEDTEAMIEIVSKEGTHPTYQLHLSDLSLVRHLTGDPSDRDERVRPGQSVVVHGDGSVTRDRFGSQEPILQSVHDGQWNDLRWVVSPGEVRTYVNGSLMHRVVETAVAESGDEDASRLRITATGPAGATVSIQTMTTRTEMIARQ